MAKEDVKSPVEDEVKPEDAIKTDAPENQDDSKSSAVQRTRAKKKKVKRNVPSAQVHVYASFNNTIVTITDQNGGALASASAGSCGFRGSKKGTAYAAQVASEKAIAIAKQQYGMSKASVSIKGVGLGRESAVRALAAADVSVDSIHDVTSIPHGGVRAKKARRV
jgi:small subunit ribosomal protein S11